MKHYIPLLGLIFVVAIGLGAATAPAANQNILTFVRVYDSANGEPIVIPAAIAGRALVRIQDRTPITTVNVVAPGGVEESAAVAVYYHAVDHEWVADGREFKIEANNGFRVVTVNWHQD